MSTYPLASSVACEDMRFRMSRYGDSPYRFYEPFYEENIFKDGGSRVLIKNKDDKSKTPSNSRLQKCSNRDSSSQVSTKISRTINTPRLLDRPIRTPSISKGDKLKNASHHTTYHRLTAIHSFMDKLESDYPSICTTSVIGKSLEGRDLKILRVSNSNASNVGVWIDAGIHAREWIAPATATYLADSIVKNFSKLPDYMTNKDWHFLPVMNPDGYEYSHTKDRMWRKNKAWHNGHIVGVDLNRNFSYGFGGFGSSDEPTNVFYHGPFAFSEPESTAVRDLILNSGTKFTVYITLHSYGQVILFPFACKAELCPSYTRLLEGATVMSKAIYNSNGNTYKVGISRDVMYGASGTSNDWSYGVAGIPYCYLLELRSKKHRFRVPTEEIEETGKEILSCVQALMEFVDNYTPLKVGSRISRISNDVQRKRIRSVSPKGSVYARSPPISIRSTTGSNRSTIGSTRSTSESARSTSESARSRTESTTSRTNTVSSNRSVWSVRSMKTAK